MKENIDKLIDINLKLIHDSDFGIMKDDLVNENGEEFQKSGEWYKAVDLAERLKNERLIKFKDELCLIENFGIDIVKNGGWIEHLKQIEKQSKFNAKREKIEFEKSKVDLELAKKMLKEYPRTKWIARISIIIGISLAILELIRASGLLDSNN